MRLKGCIAFMTATPIPNSGSPAIIITKGKTASELRIPIQNPGATNAAEFASDIVSAQFRILTAKSNARQRLAPDNIPSHSYDRKIYRPNKSAKNATAPKAPKENTRMNFKRASFWSLTIAAFAFAFAAPSETKAQNFSDQERALIETAKFACYEYNGGANQRTDIQAELRRYEKVFARNRASRLSSSSPPGSLIYYYGMVPIEKFDFVGQQKWYRAYFGVQKIYVFVGTKCPILSSTSLEEFLKMNCPQPSCRLVKGWQNMIIKSKDAPD
ncbi:MAG: hypothetical protein K9G60_02975 [Pseudolabrys sp.]|nr:hypothetical protein [Pseudolabrys sp.]